MEAEQNLGEIKQHPDYRNWKKYVRGMAVLTAIAICYGLWGQDVARRAELQLAHKDDTIHTQAATIAGDHEVQVALKTSIWRNYDQLQRHGVDIDTLKVQVAWLRAQVKNYLP